MPQIDNRNSKPRRWFCWTLGMYLGSLIGLYDFFATPFLPNAHKARGVSVSVNGVIFGISPAGEVIAATLILLFFSNLQNRKTFTIVGTITIAICTILFGELNRVFPANNELYIPLAIF